MKSLLLGLGLILLSIVLFLGSTNSYAAIDVGSKVQIFCNSRAEMTGTIKSFHEKVIVLDFEGHDVWFTLQNCFIIEQ